MSTALWYRIKDWLAPSKRLSLEERNKLLEKKAVETEERAAFLETEAKLRERLVSAEKRCREARRGIGIWKSGIFRWVLGAIVAILILSVMFKGC